MPALMGAMVSAAACFIVDDDSVISSLKSAARLIQNRCKASSLPEAALFHSKPERSKRPRYPAG